MNDENKKDSYVTVFAISLLLENYYDDNNKSLVAIRQTRKSAEEFAKKNYPHWEVEIEEYKVWE